MRRWLTVSVCRMTRAWLTACRDEDEGKISDQGVVLDQNDVSRMIMLEG
jgi:hypothetical protein